MTHGYNRHLADLRFVNHSAPTLRADGTTLIDHATEISYTWASKLWNARIKRLEKIKDDYQVVVLPPHPGDVAEKIIDSKLPVFSAKYPLATCVREQFPGNEEDRLHIVNEAPLAKHIYLIASPTTKADVLDIQRVAWHYSNVLRAEYITAILPFFPGTRQDKNVDPNGEYMPSPINIAADIESLTRVNSFMAIEAHSFATETAASTIEKPLLPTTPWKFLIGKILNTPIKISKSKTITLTVENTVEVRPDQGRNIAALRAAKYYQLESASFIKKRLDPKTVTLEMKASDRRKVLDKECIVYDDEFATASTLAKIATKLNEYGAKGLTVVGVHGKFLGNWEENIQNPIIRKIFISDSRSPIGNIKSYLKSGKIEVLSVESFIASLIEADLQGVNFWKDANYKHLVLQSMGRSESH